MTGPRVNIVGGGTMGLACAWALARRGARVTVFERFGHVHTRGSHGGHTRIIREAYHEGPGYVPLVRQAAIEWESLAIQVGTPLLVRTGMVELGPADAPGVRETLAANIAAEVDHQVIDGREAQRRWGFTVPSDWVACVTPAAGYLRVGPCLDALRQMAEAAGATVCHDARVREVIRDARGVHVLLDAGTVVRGDLAVVAAGAYLPSLLPGFLPQRLKVLRRVLAWTRPAAAMRPLLADFPVWGVFAQAGFFYGFPWVDEGIDGFKLANHGGPAMADELGVDPEVVDRDVHPDDLHPLAEFLQQHLPAAQGPFVGASVCLYTCTPSWDFAIDLLPEDRRIAVVGGLSGHGFKFAPSLGQHVADGLLAGAMPAALAAFSRAQHLADP